ncbi:hypothetical protein [Labedella endophytica]|uniref:Lipoprotein n=1 Tax=Labedella endophytica TaxID=1523160 RepID=A0A433JWB5_9MICO|nr:hypothetical protein [Labedella endophytica]RUR03399.1 hypothetical protein ELQ94_02320 [Labedella endophytica]
MKKTIAAWTIAVATVFGLAACSSADSADTGSESAASSAPSASAPVEEAPASGASVEDACAAVQAQIEDASTAVTEIDMSQASSDPQGTVDAFSETVDAIGAAAESVDNAEVKAAVTAVYDDFVEMRDLLSKVLVDQDMEAAGDMATVVTDVQTSAQDLATLCS